jgi:hypothetical protein
MPRVSFGRRNASPPSLALPALPRATTTLSWTRVDPSTVPNYRNVAGLPDVNTGRFVIQGVLTSTDGVTVRSALALDGNAGGIDEVLIPKAAKQVTITSVSGVDPPL